MGSSSGQVHVAYKEVHVSHCLQPGVFFNTLLNKILNHHHDQYLLLARSPCKMWLLKHATLGHSAGQQSNHTECCSLLSAYTLLKITAAAPVLHSFASEHLHRTCGILIFTCEMASNNFCGFYRQFCGDETTVKRDLNQPLISSPPKHII